MIAIINDGANLYGSIAYNYEKVKTGNGTVLSTNRIIQNIFPEKDLHVHLAMESFEPYLVANKRTSKPVTHISINPDSSDQLSDEQYIFLAKDYLEKMNFTDQPYIIYKHTDIDRTHLHVITTRIGEEGNKKVSDSNEKIRNKVVCRELEVKHKLRQIGNTHSRSQQLLKPAKVDYNKSDIKKQIKSVARFIVDNYKFQTFGEYSALLAGFNIQAKQVPGPEDNPVVGVIYSPTNDKGEAIGVPIKSSLMGKMFGNEALQKQMKRHSETWKKGKIKLPPKCFFAAAMKDSKDLDTFRKNLNKYNMDVVFRINDSGRLYGVTFIDHNQQVAFNGSRLGKDFSANVFNDLFNKPEDKPTDQNSVVHTAPEARTINENKPDHKQKEIEIKLDNILSEFDGEDLFDSPSIVFHGEDLEYEFRKRMKKRRRRKGFSR